MAYADKTYYRDTYLGRECADGDTLDKWLSRGADDIDLFVNSEIDTDELTARQLAALQKANCAQAEYYVVNGDDAEGYTSASLGSFSYSTKGDDETEAGGLCDRARRYLLGAGLLFRGVPCARSL